MLPTVATGAYRKVARDEQCPGRLKVSMSQALPSIQCTYSRKTLDSNMEAPPNLVPRWVAAIWFIAVRDSAFSLPICFLQRETLSKIPEWRSQLHWPALIVWTVLAAFFFFCHDVPYVQIMWCVFVERQSTNPLRSVVYDIVSTAIRGLAFSGVYAVLTLMQPYFLLDANAPLPCAFEYVNMKWTLYSSSIGALCVLSIRYSAYNVVWKTACVTLPAWRLQFQL